MNAFTNIMERSDSIRHFAEKNRLEQDDIYSLYMNCYIEYRENFKQRIHFGKQIQQIISEYKHIPEFVVLHPSELVNIIFRSDTMAHWFAFMFWKQIDQQLQEGRSDVNELMIELKFSGALPSKNKMEEILYEQKSKKIAGNRILPEGSPSETGREESRIRVAVNH